MALFVVLCITTLFETQSIFKIYDQGALVYAIDFYSPYGFLMNVLLVETYLLHHHETMLVGNPLDLLHLSQTMFQCYCVTDPETVRLY